MQRCEPIGFQAVETNQHTNLMEDLAQRTTALRGYL